MVYFHVSLKGGVIAVFACVFVLVFAGYSPTVIKAQASSLPVQCTIATYGDAWNGQLAFPMQNQSNGLVNYPDYLIVMTTDGQLVAQRESDGYNALYNIANNTLLFQGEPLVDGPTTAPVYATHIWNLATNITQDFPDVTSHHDIQYDPANNTFLTLVSYVRTVDNTTYLFDKIVQVDASGKPLWTWDTYGHIPLSEATTFDETSDFNGQTVLDFTHMNTLDWDYNHNIIFVNSRLTNTFYKINQTSGDIIWACGEYGNFTLMDSEGKQVSSLWYGCHDLKEVAPNVFTLFNNDYDNKTNPDDCRSSLMQITVNETSKTAYATFNWQAPRSYWTVYGGANMILPNGDYLGCFGTPTHQFQQNKPWDFNDTGAVFVEVNPSGQVVRTFTFPVGYYAYRLEAMINITSDNPSPTPTPIPEFTSLAFLCAFVVAVSATAMFVYKRHIRLPKSV